MKTVLLLLTMVATLLATIGEVTAIHGTAKLHHQATQLTVEKGLGVNIEDLLVTEQASKVQVILHDNTIVTIGPNSEYLFERYEEGDHAEIAMVLQKGFFKIITGKIGKISPQRFKVKTKSAVIGIRGTQFMALVNDNEEKIGCSKGQISVTTLEKIYALQKGEMLIYQNNQWHKEQLDVKSFSPQAIKPNKKQKAERIDNYSFMPGLENNDVRQE